VLEIEYNHQSVNLEKMQPEKRKTLESFFRSFKKKNRDDGAVELNPIESSASNSPSSSSFADKQMETDSTSSSIVTAVSSTNTPQARSIPDDISKSCDEPPAQPKLKNYPMNDQKRAFRSIWFTDRPWLEYSVMKDSVYCYYCRHFSSNKLNVGDAFISTGFNNWKRSLESSSGLVKHSSCQSHIIATKNHESYLQSRATNSSVINKLDSSRLIHIRRNRDRLIKICSAIHLLSRQMISLRGHVENERYANSTHSRNILLFSVKNRSRFFASKYQFFEF